MQEPYSKAHSLGPQLPSLYKTVWAGKAGLQHLSNPILGESSYYNYSAPSSGLSSSSSKNTGNSNSYSFSCLGSYRASIRAKNNIVQKALADSRL
jgi:hypothetical protein